MRFDLDNALLAIQACAVQYNLSIRWGDVATRDMFDDGRDGLDWPDDVVDDVVIDYNELPRYKL